MSQMNCFAIPCDLHVMRAAYARLIEEENIAAGSEEARRIALEIAWAYVGDGQAIEHVVREIRRR